jgi:lipid A 3-O-deacylase
VAAFSTNSRNFKTEKRRTLIRSQKLCVYIFLFVVGVAATTNVNAAAAADRKTAESPVAEVRNARLLEMGPFAYWGTGIGDRSDFKFSAVGFQAGKPITPILHAGMLSGQFELGANIMPFWQAYTPAPHEQTFVYQGKTYVAPVGGGTYTGVSLTPVILRWNFLTKSRRVQPWFQGAGGLIYTTHKFPPEILVPRGTPGATSVFNFSPQGGIGLHYFTCPRRSIDLGVNAVHISSASLGDRNPGVNASLQVQLGYTWWK